MLAFHGIPGCRLSFRFMVPDAMRGGIRLICPERPGCGRSDYCKGRTLLDFAEDLRSLITALGLDEFLVLGLSGGAPYALALCRILGNAVRAVGIVSGMGPVDDPGLLAQSTGLQRLALHLFRDTPGFVSLLCILAGLSLRRFPARFWLWLAGRLPRAGREGLCRDDFQSSILEPLREPFRSGHRAVAQDLALMTLPWGFRVEEITNSIRLWHGERDRDIPIVVAKSLAVRLRSCHAQWLPDAGHLWILGHIDVVLERLAATWVDSRLGP